MPDQTAQNLLRDLLSHEKQVWDALVAGDPAVDAQLLCDSFLGVYPDGFADKAAHVAQLADGPSIRHYSLDGAHARALGPDHAVLSYRATYQRSNAPRQETMYVTSVWQRRGSGWINLLSQDTPAKAPRA